jgi:hypothetical protein
VDVGPLLDATACLCDWFLDIMPMMGMVESVFAAFVVIM